MDDAAVNNYNRRIALAFPIPVVQRNPFEECRRINNKQQQHLEKTRKKNQIKNKHLHQQNSQEFATKKAKPIIDFQKVDDVETNRSANSLDRSTESHNMNPLPKKDKNRKYK